MKRFIILLVQLLIVVSIVTSESGNEPPGTSVLLRDVSALTLHKDRYTTGRRSGPVPQLRCVGGSAGCRAFVVPQVVQCINKGWDGVDVQWQCQADMDSWYRFGEIVVSCEGYSHPKDAYILTGSCGLEYKLELTEEGAAVFLAFLLVVLLVMAVLLFIIAYAMAYVVYQIFLIVSPTHPPPYNPGYGSPYNPGYGFHNDYYSNQKHCPGACASTGTGGFWSGLWTGGILGYLFGSEDGPGPADEPPGDNDSTGTRTASGFGGTNIR